MSRCQTALLALAFLAVAVVIQIPALRGELISDDRFLLEAPEIQQLDARSLRAILDPRGPVTAVFLNYAPVHALLHAVEIQVFGDDRLGYHLVNVAVHALVSVLLAALLLRVGVPRGAAYLGAAVFLVHPANVEAVAWISQLKTTSAAALALAALLALPPRPALATALFGLALLAKPQAVFALPVAAVLAWARPCAAGPDPRRAARWIAVWALLVGLFAWVEAPVFLQGGVAPRTPFEEDRFLHLRTIVAIAARYLALASGGHGASTLHEPPPAVSLADPWWLAGLAVLPLLGARLIWTLRERRVEAAFWIWALAVYAPVSQVLPFVNMMADRYLYMLLPGLIGGVLLAGRDVLPAPSDTVQSRWAVRAGTAAALGLSLLFAWRSFDRAHAWRDEDAYLIDAALHYPDGSTAHLLRAKGSARLGDVDAAVASLRAARARGWTWIGVLFADPAFAKARRDPKFQRFVRELTAQMIASLEAQRRPGHEELQTLAQLHLWRGERREAEAALERAVALGGPGASGSRASLEALRTQRAPGGAGARRGAPLGLDAETPLLPNPVHSPGTR